MYNSINLYSKKVSVYVVSLFKGLKPKKIETIERNGIRVDFDVTDENDPKPLIANFNVFGIDLEYDFSEEAEKERQKQRDLDEKNEWTIANGEYLNFSERKLIDSPVAHKVYSLIGNYCLVYDKGFNVESAGKIWLVDCIEKRVVYCHDVNVIDKVFVTGLGLVVINHYIREPKSFITAYNVDGKKVFEETKDLYLEISNVTEDGEITGHYLDKTYSTFKFKPR